MSDFKVGDRVVLSENGKDVYRHNMKGVVTATYTDGGVKVKWENGEVDTYIPKYLELPVKTKWHVHDKLIREWLDNPEAIVQYRYRKNSSKFEDWITANNPSWNEHKEYRIIYPKVEKTVANTIKEELESLKQAVKELEDKLNNS